MFLGTANDYSSRTLVVIIYLQKHQPLSFFSFISKKESAPTIIWVSHSWGLPRSTLSISRKTTSLWHFYRYSCHILMDLGIFPAVNSRNCCPSLFFRQARTLRASQPVRAWTFLYSINATAITQTSTLHPYYIRLNGKKQWKLMYHEKTYVIFIDQSNNLLPNTCFSRLDNLFKISKLVVPGVAVVVG